MKKEREYSVHDWSKFFDRIILNLAGYKNLGVIAKFVRRSERVVWHRLVTLEKSCEFNANDFNAENNVVPCK